MNFGDKDQKKGIYRPKFFRFYHKLELLAANHNHFSGKTKENQHSGVLKLRARTRIESVRGCENLRTENKEEEKREGDARPNPS